jgi:hypothetical protein
LSSFHFIRNELSDSERCWCHLMQHSKTRRS